jgi:hypothetical protein
MNIRIIILEARTRAIDMAFFTSIRLQTTARQGSIQYMKSFNIFASQPQTQRSRSQVLLDHSGLLGRHFVLLSCLF